MTPRTRIVLAAALGAAAFALAGAPAFAARSTTLEEERCDVQERVGSRVQTIDMPDLHVLAQTAEDGRFAPDLPRRAGAIVCLRSSVMPAAHDDEAVATGLPLFLVEYGGRQHRTGVLEIQGGIYSFRLTEGRLAADEQAAVATQLAEFQARAQAASQAAPH
jgi:hypothetical protein